MPDLLFYSFHAAKRCLARCITGRNVEDALRADLERAKLERDTATTVVENIQGKVAMYAGKYEMEKKAREKAEAERDEAISRVQSAASVVAEGVKRDGEAPQ